MGPSLQMNMTARGLVGMDDLTTRLHGAAAALEEFHSMPDGEDHLDLLLERLADAARRTVLEASAASVTVLRDEGRSPWTAAATHNAVVAIDLEQYNSGAGPCLEAARERHPVRGGLKEARERWPAVAESADTVGIRCYLSVPLLLGDRPLLGSLNIYGRTEDGFGPLDEALITFLTSAASAAIVNARRYVHARARADEIAVALTSRAEIDQAKGILMAQNGIPAARAFEMLVDRSQHSNVKLRDVARDLLRSVTGPARLD
jgi:GAF domain-containing protein